MTALMQELNSFTGWLLIASLKSLPLIAVLLLAQYGLKKYLSAGARHSLWLSLFLCLSIPFGWQHCKTQKNMCCCRETMINFRRIYSVSDWIV